MFDIEELEVGAITLQGVTRGGAETSIYVPEVGIMFDVGMCPWGADQRSDLVLISHGHADHIAGLHYLCTQRNLRKLAAPETHMPEEITDQMTQIMGLWSKVEHYDIPINFHGHAPGSSFSLGSDLRARCLRTTHRIPSLGWLVERISQRLRPEFSGRPGQELANLRKQGVVLTQEHITPLLCVTGDTQIEFFDQNEVVRQAKVLVHEVTSWDDRRGVETTRHYGHTHLEEILERADAFKGDALVLVHRSNRHSRAEAEDILERRCPASLKDRVFLFG